jgi:PAS domain S-box-containing protein
VSEPAVQGGSVTAEQLLELRASEARFRAFIEHARDAIIEIDPAAKILYASPRFATMTGYPLDLVEGHSGLDFVHPDDLAVVDDLRAHAMETETGVEVIFRFRHSNGSWRWFELAGQPFRTPDGELRAVLIVRDVTERIRLEQDRLAQMELESRIAELSRRLMAVDSENLDRGVQQELAAAAAMGTADRCYLVSTMSPGDTRSFEWTADGIADRGEFFTSDSPRNNMWATRQLLDGNVVRVPDVETLPEEARASHNHMRELGVQSFLLIPVRAGKLLVAVLGFHCVSEPKVWSDHEVYVLRLAAELFVSALRRRGAEAAFHASEDRFRALSENAEDAIVEIDEEGRFQYANPSYESLVGYTLDELRVMAPFELVLPGERERMRQMHEHATAEPGSAGTLLYNVRHRDGSHLCLEASGRGFCDATQAFRMVAVIRDVTEREQNQRSLERQLGLETQTAVLSRRFLALSTSEVDDGIREGVAAVGRLAEADRCWLVPADLDDAPAFEWSRTGRPIVGSGAGNPEIFELPWVSESFRADGVLHIASPDDLPEAGSDVQRMMRIRGVRSFLAIRLASERGVLGYMGFETHRSERSWDEETMRLLRFVGELFVSALKRKRAEIDLASSQAQLLQAQKMEAVGTLAGGVAHDFNNQLAVILGNARHLLRGGHNEAESRDALVDLERAAEHCAQLTHSLLAFSRQAPAQVRPVDVNEVLMDARELLVPLMPSSIEFDVLRSGELEPVCADPTQLQQVIVNLAVNARDAMPDGGSLSVSSRNRQFTADEAAELGFASSGVFVEVVVADSGTGMDETTRSRIFEPFFTTKGTGKGTGLGLATAYGIVQSLDGAIDVESELGSGTSFRILLPCTSEHDSDPGDVDTPSDGSGNETVLLVEDEDAVRRLVARMLSEKGYSVLEATDGIDALRISQDHEGEIDLAVTDLVMPNLSGEELARRLVLSRPEMGVLFISGFADRDPDLANSSLLGKPFTQPELLARVRALLDGPAGAI